jgi:hypothetical protein
VKEWWRELVDVQTPRKRKGAASLFMVVEWEIWKERNARVFERHPTHNSFILDRIKTEVQLWTAAGARITPSS